MSSFHLIGLDHQPFAALFERSDAALREIGALRTVATESPGFACRVSLEDAEVGDELLLLPYLHQPARSPYRASGPIFVRRGVARRLLAPGEVPAYVERRVISVRAYDHEHMMVAASVCEGAAAAAEIARHFSAGSVTYLHLHNAKQGCFSCRVERV